MTRQITLSPYDSHWAARFETARAELEQLLGPMAVAVHHIGSTAIPGLIAKPTIDVLLEVRDLTALLQYRSGFEALGYVWRGENGIVGRCYFQRGNSTRTHHLHAYVAGHPEVARHLRFRDYLRENPAAVARYALAKEAALAAHTDQAAAYQQHKSATVAALDQAALEWWLARRPPAACQETSDPAQNRG